MYNLYFKLNDNNIYMRSMQYMIAVDGEGKEVVEFYNPELFISVEEYFKQAEYVGYFAERTESISNAQASNQQAFALLYKTENLGIGYEVDTNSYKLLPKEYMYNSWVYSDECTSVETNKVHIVKSLLMKNMKTNSLIENEVKKLNRIKKK